MMSTVDALLVPTAPRCYAISEILADPIVLNTGLRIYRTLPTSPTSARSHYAPAFGAMDFPPVSRFLPRHGTIVLSSSFGRRWEQYCAANGATLRCYQPALDGAVNFFIATASWNDTSGCGGRSSARNAAQSPAYLARGDFCGRNFHLSELPPFRAHRQRPAHTRTGAPAASRIRRRLHCCGAVGCPPR